MKKIFIVSVLVLAIVSAFVFVSARPPACPIQSDTSVVIYGDTGNGGVGTPSKSWQTHFFDWWHSYDPNVKYVFLDRNDVKSDCDLSRFPNVKLYVQPGGDAYYQQNALGSQGKANILNFINSGKGFFGTCAGFYYVAGDYYWQGKYYSWSNLLGIFPTLEGSVTDIADYDNSPGYALTPLSNGFNAIYYGGPTRGWRNTPNTLPVGAENKASFAALPNYLPAVVKYNNMLLTSVHLEAFENDGITGLSSEQRIENYKLLANNINEVAGTSFYVPAYTNPSQCNDGIDNDGDGFVDMADSGCVNAGDNDETDLPMTQCNDGIDNDGDGLVDLTDLGCVDSLDNNETDPTGPTELFFDDFESGSLSGWVLTKVFGGNDWANAVTNPYQGARYAQSQPMSTNEPASVMERSISTSGYASVTVSYYKRLVGLDVADEFQAKWFDGAQWNVLEFTGSNSANDAGYVLKTFDLPANAGDNSNFKIRFECTAGAVSEYCRVDNVNVEGQ